MSPRLRSLSSKSSDPRNPVDRASRDKTRNRLTPVARAIATLLLTGGVSAQAYAQTQPVSGAWFASRGAVERNVSSAQGGMVDPGNGLLNSAARQHAEARQQLARSVENLGRTASAIAAQQAAQKAAREAAAKEAGVPDGYVQGGVWDRDAAGNLHVWTGAERPVHTQDNGQHTVAIKQTESKAVLNWESFNVGRNTTVQFQQKASDAVLNRVVGADTAPSQIQGAIKGDGTVMVVNQNGVVFSGTSQVNVRNLVTAAAKITDQQFKEGLYGKDANTASFTNAQGKIEIHAGARIGTHASETVNQGGGYVLLLGQEVHNAGSISTPGGQAALAAGENFIIRKGMGTEENVNSTTRGNTVVAQAGASDKAGLVRNTGVIQAATGDITLAGRTISQDGVLVASTSVHNRGTIHLQNNKTDAQSSVTLGKDSVTAIVLDESAATALDVQREALIKESDKEGDGLRHRRDQSLVQIASGGDVVFDADSLTLATGGQVFVDAARNSEVRQDAVIDVSGHVGVRVAMEANNLMINIQGNEQRDAPVNREGDNLRSSDVWLDRRNLVFVPAGTNGYEKDRWYTAGGLLEVGGYLGVASHSIGEWAAQGGTVQFSGASVVTRPGSLINLSGGTLDVQSGYLRQSWLRGVDGRLYTVDSAPGDLLYTGLYKGYEQTSARWGQTRSFYNPILAPTQRYEEGYTVGRDAGRLVISTKAADLQGHIESEVYQGPRQIQAPAPKLDGYQQSQTAVARRAELILGGWTPVYDKDTQNLRYSPSAVVEQIVIGKAQAQEGGEQSDATSGPSRISLDSDWLTQMGLGALRAYASQSVEVNDALELALGGEIALHANQVDVKADLTARGGRIVLGDLVDKWTSASLGWQSSKIADVAAGAIAATRIDSGVTLDTRGFWSNQELDSRAMRYLPWRNGGEIILRSSGDVTVAEHALLDVSSAAAYMADGSVLGGKGGNITLAADAYMSGVSGIGGRLVFEGEIRGHGVAGGGTLRLQTGETVVLGGAVQGSDGVLQAGQSSLADLLTTEAFTIAAGAILPVDFHYMRTHAAAGEVIGGAPKVEQANQSSWIHLTTPWTLPKPSNENSSYSVWLSNGQQLRVDGYSWSVAPTLPAGTVIMEIMNPASFPTNYVVPADILPDGIAIAPSPGVYKAGTVAHADLSYSAGTLLRAGTRLTQDVAVGAMLHLDSSLFQKGFANYDVIGGYGVAVAEGANLALNMPVMQLDLLAARQLANGGDLSQVASLWLPPEFSESPEKGSISQRGGADLSLTAGFEYKQQDVGPSGPTLSVGKAAQISVDDGRNIVLQGSGQITVDGSLRASGGKIGIYGLSAGSEDVRHLKGHDGSIWLGSNAVLDVSGKAMTAVDAQGQRYGKVLNGGRIEIGSKYQQAATQVKAIDSFVIVREGARLLASGAAATLDMPGQGAQTIASNGGVIHLASFNGLYLDGDMQAWAGGVNAAGGTLSVALESPNYEMSGGPGDRVLAHREMTLVQEQQLENLPLDLQAGRADAGLVYGHARVGVDRIQAGGFDNLALLSNGILSIENGVDLQMGQSLHLATPKIALAPGSMPGATVKLAAPHVRLAGATHPTRDKYVTPLIQALNSNEGRLPELLPDSYLRIDANVLDIANQIAFGALGRSLQSGKAEVSRAGFDTVDLRAQNDLRFLKHAVGDRTQLLTEGDLVLAAGRIYPGTGVTAEVISGRYIQRDQWNNPLTQYDPQRSLRIERIGSGPVAQPYSVLGVLRLMSGNIDQGGVLLAPLGQLELGVGVGGASQAPTSMVMRPGSITSVSAAGLIMPYGGTVDGLTYNYAGSDAPYVGLGGLLGNLSLKATSVDVQEGALLDLSGGGELTGAGFLPGRGGSTDARLHPLIQSTNNGFMLPELAGNPVYAVVPGVQQVVAPLAADNGAGDPMVGRQIRIGEGVPGLAAGTYTLLPSTYALLPGAYRVEISGSGSASAAMGGTIAMRNGSYNVAARLGIANTHVMDAMPSRVVLTSADTLRQYSQYNETSYSQFGLDWATRDSVPRPQLERDARQLQLEANRLQVASGVAKFEPAQNGRGGNVVLTGQRIEVLADGAAPTAGFDGMSVESGVLNRLGAAGISIGGSPTSTFALQGYGSTRDAWRVSLGNTRTDEIYIRGGAVLEAAQVFLVVGNREKGLTVEQGATINTLGKGAAPWDSSEGYVLQPGQKGVLALSNGWLDVTAPSNDDSWGTVGAGFLHIGTCAVGSSCSGETRLYSEGTITAATNKTFELDESVRYGTRNLVLAMGGINVGGAQALSDASAAGILPSGLTLNQRVLERLLRGDTQMGAPALENLVLTARDSVNFYGDVNLSTLDPVTGKSALERLVLSAAAIYGYGDANSEARIETGILVWNGATTPAGSIVEGGAGTGNGHLVFDAQQIEFGYGPKSQPDTVGMHDRLALGFSSVNLNASERITANHKGSLSVYHSRGAWDAASNGWTYQGGNLNISTPLFTGQAGSVNNIRAGGNIAVTRPQGSSTVQPDLATAVHALGAELSLDAARSLVWDSAALLPSGKLKLSAQDDVVLQEGAQLDLAGRPIGFFDVNKYSWGGEVVLESRGGNVTQAAESLIDVSAQHNRAGKLTALALNGLVDLRGRMLGAGTGHYDAGGTLVPFASGFIELRGQQIADFAGLNARLNEGSVWGGRSFQLRQGDLLIGNELKAREINVSVDNGSLTVNGTIDASGEQAGSIRLAAKRGVTLTGSAVLDASASVLRRDSYGQVIEAPNRAVIEIDSGQGRLVLADGMRMNLSVAGSHANYGTVALNAPRLGGATGNDVDIDARGALNITGARSIAVNAFQQYDDAQLGLDETVDGRSYQRIDQDYLRQKHLDSETFINKALANQALMQGKLAGLRAYGDQFHLRPGVEIVSNAVTNPDGDLHVDGDIDLSGYRYASVNPHAQKSSVYGSGEAAALVLRAAGDLTIFGSLTDGFNTSVLGVTADDGGWVLPAGRMPFGGDLIIPHGGMATLDVGTQFAAGRTVNYDLPVEGMSLPRGTVIPSLMSLAQGLSLQAGTVLSAAVLDASGQVVYAAGTVLKEAVTLQANMQLAAGFRLPEDAQMAATLWPKGVPLPVLMKLNQQVALKKGALVPSETDVVLPGGAVMVDLRPRDGDDALGRMLALAPMLAAGSQSWDLRLVAGADTSAADNRLTLIDTERRLMLADTHFGLGVKSIEIPGTGKPAVYGWGEVSRFEELIELLAGGYWLSFVPVSGEQVTQAQIEELQAYGIIGTDITELNIFGMGDMAAELSPATPPEMQDVKQPAREQLFSVLRTGVGDLDLVSGGDIEMNSLYGVYTAGTPSASMGAAYNQARGKLFDGTILRAEGKRFESLVDGGADSLYQAWYPEKGGNVLLRAQGSVKGDLVGNNDGKNDLSYTFYNTRQQIASTAVGNWLWRQGTGSAVSASEGTPSAWWVNFGTYVAGTANGGYSEYDTWLFANDPFLAGFTGVGTLGGGNLTVEAGADAGMLNQRGIRSSWNQQTHTPRSQGLHLVVGSTGRITPGGELVQTGGGDLVLRLGGTLNPNPDVRLNEHDLNSTLVNLRGAIALDAGAVGGVKLGFGGTDQMDTRPGNIYASGGGAATGGPILVLGDSAVRMQTRGDLVLGSTVDPGRTLSLSSTPFSVDGQHYDGNGWSWFSLWTPATAIDLLSVGGNLTPTTSWDERNAYEDTRWGDPGRNQSHNADGHFYPSILRAAAANGNIQYGASASDATVSSNSILRYGFGTVLAPSPMGEQFVNATGRGELQFLVGGSIQAAGYVFSASAADAAAMSSPFRPAFVGLLSQTGGGEYGYNPRIIHNVDGEAVKLNDWFTVSSKAVTSLYGGRQNTGSLFVFGTPVNIGTAAAQRQPARYYAVNGDIVGLRVGQEVLLGYPPGSQGSRMEGSVPVAIRAGRDITDSGTRLGQKDAVAGAKSATATTRGNLITHAWADDISIVEAGRDVRNSSFYILGPGLLDVSAGRHVYLADKGEIKSLGPLSSALSDSRGGGASISVSAGMGEGAHWNDFAARYLNPENQADLELPFADQQGKALYIYSGGLTLGQWLQREFGYTGDESGAQAFLQEKQGELDQVRDQARAEGRNASSRPLAREYKLESQLHLVNWLSTRFGDKNGLGLHFDAASMDARSFFEALPPEQQRSYLRNVYYAELKASGREYNDSDSKRAGSYLRGREAIATLFPEQDAQGKALSYMGDLTMYSSALYYDADYVNNTAGKSRPNPKLDYITKAEWEALGSPGYNVSFYDVLDAGIHTNFGGDISILTPGGRALVGIDGGFNPGPGSGVITQGEGDINFFSQSDILMGQSRVFTTFGGNILAWSAAGDINAGRGSKTTVVYTPQRRVYDLFGNVALSPSTPNTGAGIATLNPVPEVPPGYIDLIAPLGTVDAGEAGIRVSGDINIAALRVVNADNIQVQGESKGIPVVATVNTGALSNASATASSAASAAQDTVNRARAQARQNLPSVITVQILGFGDAGQSGGGATSSGAGPATSRIDASAYRQDSTVQVLGLGANPQSALDRLTPEERRRMTL
ncbi:filamentous hemagglutinin family protein [Alcaligenes faecalis]|uniref:filamentous haemagglutinin family protein n=1 Tax=Alcaligenes faecalis TaxID=511 RepID=UPI00211C73CA|nr:filamentous haemagglutinin family protein [Alcaligenes faecalis]UUO10728.1 filamentous hemagglutinin family protein [Alcaligenes faecalis]